MHPTKKSLRAVNYLKVVVSEIRSLIGFMAAERRSTAGGPVFLVGCSHSGTSATLMLLAKAPSVPVVLDESRFFLFHRSGFLHELSALVSRRAFSQLRAASLHAREGGGVWVEKTPRHVRFTNRIKFWIPSSRFIGLWRDPLDVVASLMGRGVSLEQAIARWIQDNSFLVQMVKDGQKVHLLQFESLIESPEQAVRNINTYLGLEGKSAVPIPELKAPPENLASRKNHAKRRSAQMVSGLFDSRGASAGDLTKANANLIKELTGPTLADLTALSKPS